MRNRGKKQKLVSFKNLPKDYVNAVVAIEDRQFFEHSGINFRESCGRCGATRARVSFKKAVVDHSAVG